MIELKAFQEDAIDEILKLFRETIHKVNAADYSPDQLKAWAPEDLNRETWIHRLHAQYAQLAYIDDKLVGFGTLSDVGLIDLLYVHHAYQRQGIAQLIYLRLEFEAYQKKIKRLITEASITAHPFFEKMGFKILFEQEKEIRGCVLKNYVMEKMLTDRGV